MKSNILILILLLILAGLGSYYFLNKNIIPIGTNNEEFPITKTQEDKKNVVNNENNINPISYENAYDLVKEGKFIYCKMNKESESYFSNYGQNTKHIVTQSNIVTWLTVNGKNYTWSTKNNTGLITDLDKDYQEEMLIEQLKMDDEQLQMLSGGVKPQCFIYSTEQEKETFAVPKDVMFK